MCRMKIKLEVIHYEINAPIRNINSFSFTHTVLQLLFGANLAHFLFILTHFNDNNNRERYSWNRRIVGNNLFSHCKQEHKEVLADIEFVFCFLFVAQISCTRWTWRGAIIINLQAVGSVHPWKNVGPKKHKYHTIIFRLNTFPPVQNCLLLLLGLSELFHHFILWILSSSRRISTRG